VAESKHKILSDNGFWIDIERDTHVLLRVKQAGIPVIRQYKKRRASIEIWICNSTMLRKLGRHFFTMEVNLGKNKKSEI
jgi:hypothetical protein